MTRNSGFRLRYLTATLGTVGLGLLVHFHGGALGSVARDMLGDALWAMMIFWLSGAIAPDASLVPRAVGAYALCVAVELSQLLHAPGLDAIRGTSIGRLVFGSGFDPRDLLAYALGVAAAASVERLASRGVGRGGQPGSPPA